jgi:mRNA-degrading endonuclease toxin of MazEF toxin-antitoxin module
LQGTTTIIAPTTTNSVGAAWWPCIDMDGTTTYVLVEQLMAADHSRLGQTVGRVSPEEMLAIDQRLRDVLDL